MTYLSFDHVAFSDAQDEPGWVKIEGKKITALGTGTCPEAATHHGGWLIPGFVDQHCHGAAGGGFECEDPELIQDAINYHRRHGTTSLVASLVSGTQDTIKRQIESLLPFCASGELAGIHLEGPYISELRKGAHDASVLRNPVPDEVADLIDTGAGYIRMLTIAPELPGAMETIRLCVEQGIVAAVGHTDATYEQAQAAIDAGATVATHLFNAMPSLHHRTPGPIAALAEDPRVFVELICDGVHVHGSMLRLARRAASTRTILITDAIAATGMADGDYTLGTLDVEVKDGTARINPGGSLAGSTLTMNRAFRHYVSSTAATVTEGTVVSASRPAHVMKLTDTGKIAVGFRADLCWIDENLNLQRVWKDGQVVEPT